MTMGRKFRERFEWASEVAREPSGYGRPDLVDALEDLGVALRIATKAKDLGVTGAGDQYRRIMTGMAKIEAWL